MTNKINIAIIGCGRIAGHHMRSINSIKFFNLVAISDLSKKKSLGYAKEFSCRHYQDYKQMLKNNSSINFVAICTPSGNHFEIAKYILSKYRINLIIEKPTFLKNEHFKIIENLSKKKKVKVYPIFQNRFNKAVRRVKKAIDLKEIGEINNISLKVHWERPLRYYNLSSWRGTYEMDGGVLTNQAIHHIDLLRYLFGEIKKIFSIKRTLNIPIKVENLFLSIFYFKSKASGMLEITTAAINKSDQTILTIMGSSGTIEIGGIAMNELKLFTPNAKECKKNSEDFSKNIYGNGHLAQYKEIWNDFNNKKSEHIKLKDSYKTSSLLHNFYTSSLSNKLENVNKKNNFLKLGKYNKSLYKLYR